MNAPPQGPVEARCSACGRAAAIAPDLYTCPRCSGTIDLLYDYPALARRLAAAGGEGVNPMLLLSPVRLAAGDALFFELLDWTREQPATRLADALGARHLTLLDETRLPSGSLKDRATLAVLLRAREIGARTVACASTGNAGASLACLAARLGMEAVVFAPKRAPAGKLRQVQAHGARLILVDGNYDLAYELCLEATRRFGWVSRNTAHNPWCAEGKKSAALALARPGVRRIADAILVPAGDGCILAGVHKGLVDLQRVGWIDDLPRLIAVQPEGSAAIADAWRAGRGIEAVHAQSVADSLVVDRPRDGEKALRALRETDGFAVTVSDQEILAAAYELARLEGIFAEPAGAASVAGLRRALADGLLEPDARVVALVTGHGLKDADALAPLFTPAPVITALEEVAP